MEEPNVTLVREFKQRIVAMLVFKGRLIIATEKGLYAGDTPETVEPVQCVEVDGMKLDEVKGGR